MRSSNFLLSLLPLCITVHAATEEYTETFVQARHGVSTASRGLQGENSPGPILETGNYDVVSSKLLKGADISQLRRAPALRPANDFAPSDHSSAFRSEQLLQLQPQQHLQQQQPLYRYDGPLDGRRVWIYKKILRPVRITSHGMERLPGAQVIDQWAEGGFGNQLHTPMRAPVYTPMTNGLFAQSAGQFAHAH